MQSYAKLFRTFNIKDPRKVAFKRYVEGDDAALEQIALDGEGFAPYEIGLFAERLPNVEALDDLDRRVLRGLTRFGPCLPLSDYAERQMAREPACDVFATLRELAQSAGVDAEGYCYAIAFFVPQLLGADGELNSAGRFVVGLSDPALTKLCQTRPIPMKGLESLIGHLARTEPARLLRLTPLFARDPDSYDWDPASRPAGWLVRHGGPPVAEALAALAPEQKLPDRIHTMLALPYRDPKRWRESALQTVLECMGQGKDPYRHGKCGPSGPRADPVETADRTIQHDLLGAPPKPD
jgi:hypothetical protein